VLAENIFNISTESQNSQRNLDVAMWTTLKARLMDALKATDYIFLQATIAVTS